MDKLCRLFKWVSVITSILVLGISSVSAQEEGTEIENLAFKILQKQAAEYELALSQMISESLTKYIPENRFHLSVRIYWNPYKIDQLKLKNQELKRKATKLPGFSVFVREEERGLDYYLGAGSVMKLKVDPDNLEVKRFKEFMESKSENVQKVKLEGPKTE